MTVTRFVAIDQIHRRPDARPLDDETVAALADSIAEVGLLNPIRVRLRPDHDYELIAGSHRLAACDALDHREIFCIEVTDDDLHAELAMIDENLVRAELGIVDRAKQTARRKVIYEALHPQTRHGENQHSRSRQLGDSTDVARFTTDTAARTGQSERSVQRDAARGERVIAEVLDMVRGTPLETGSYLDKIKKLQSHEQFTAAKRDLAFARKQAAEDAKKADGKQAPAKATASSAPPRKISEPTPSLSHTDLLAILDRLATIAPAAVAAACPPRERAALCSRLSHLIDVFQTIMEGVAP